MKLVERTALTFDDVLLVPQKSAVVPKDVNVQTVLCKGIALPLPIVSAPMDTVTESSLAVALARAGGVGVIHRNMPADTQAKEVAAVKASAPAEKSAPPSALDSSGKLLVGGAIGVNDLTRAVALEKAGVDFIAVDSAHGHSKNVIETVKALVKQSSLPIIAGNVVTKEAIADLASAGASAIKVGVGSGAICTTRIVAGVGVPQISAVMECAAEAKQHNVSVIADGGIRYSGDITKALAAGARAVMLGGLLAGTDEAPGKTVKVGGRTYKQYRGMGSLGAMNAGSSDRYAQSAGSKLVPEGVEGTVPSRGTVADNVFQLIGGLKSGMGYCGAANLAELHEKAVFIVISGASLKESHPHSIFMTEDAPNYKSGR